ncbi:universal stress protein [Haloarcula litorea]|uniref:universal stress protein n=1 Tax=Haloarcula litorea TaxID=3032579 RepID=UPI0023E8BDA7|nr:universal stress protein [Halomicroarcula sp. GDY20]
MYDTILVPTDGSEHAVRAAEHGAYLADLFDATVHVVSVVAVSDAAGPFSAGGVDEAFVERLESAGLEAIEAVEDLLGDVVTETATVRGSPGEAILDYVDDHGVDLVAMGTHGRTGVRRYVAGSVAEHVVRHADVPVLTGRVTDASVLDDGYDEVLLPTDGSEAADAAVDHAVAVAAAAGARLHAVSVINLDDVVASPDYTMPTGLLDQLQSEAEEATGEIVDRAREAGADAVAEVRQGYPTRDLLEYAEDNEVDLVAMGTQGRTGLRRVLLGSTTERLIRRSEVPVLAVRANREDA